MRLHFDKEQVDRLLEHTRNAESHNSLYGMAETARAGLWLVGDQGVYLMSNGNPDLRDEEKGRSVVCYADECNPETLEFDDWWENKRASFGGDDGVEFLEAEFFANARVSDRKNPKITIDVTATKMEVIKEVQTAKR